jgi:hypothetical protein
MGVIEDVRQVLQDFLASELREIRGQFAAIDKRLDTMDEISRVRFKSITQRLEIIQQSFAFDKRISSLEEDKRCLYPKREMFLDGHRRPQHIFALVG